jgi:hypothetical protein
MYRVTMTNRNTNIKNKNAGVYRSDAYDFFRHCDQMLQNY